MQLITNCIGCAEVIGLTAWIFFAKFEFGAFLSYRPDALPAAQPTVLWRCWLGSRKGIRPVKKISGGVLAWLSVRGEVQMCISLSACHSHLLSLTSVKSRLVLPFGTWLTRVILDKIQRAKNGCVCVTVQHYAKAVYAIVVCLSVWCACSIPAAEWLDSSAVGTAQLAHVVGKSILCHKGWRCGSLGRICYIW